MKIAAICLFVFVGIVVSSASSLILNIDNKHMKSSRQKQSDKSSKKSIDFSNVKLSQLDRLLSINGGFKVPFVTTQDISLNVVKIALQVLLTGLNIVCWSLPLRNKNFSQNHQSLSRANVFAGGIMLMLCFGHLIPHSLADFESVGLSLDVMLKFTLAGLLAMFFVEKVAFNSHELLHSHSDTHSHSLAVLHESLVAGVDNTSHDHNHDHVHSKECNLNDTNPSALGKVTVPVSERGTIATLSNQSALLLLFAMSLHSIFETIALGLAADKSSVFYMATSIGLHQPAESIALLIAFLKTNMPTRTIVSWLSLFSLVGPLGVTIGIFIKKVSAPLTQAIIVALTAGTFLYLGATEVLNEEFEGVDTVEKWKRFGLLLGGIFTISSIDFVSGKLGIHTHSHSHNDLGHSHGGEHL